MSDRERSSEATELFLRVADLSPAEREKVLAKACGGRMELRREVEELLASDAPTSILHARLGRIGVETDAAPLPDRIGPYEVVSLIGTGGMGRVYDARQKKPIERRVAIKVVRPRRAGERVLARFAFEQRTLARMDHPNIARILDAGRTESGAPYFVMEHVDGVELLKYARERGLSLDARLALFEAICAGVEHAHQKGIIHRDIKPGNVLVAEVDGRPVPKIIDFGIARAVRGETTADGSTDDGGATGVAAPATRVDERPGTPGYMSPEQLASAEVDTRTDVFSLGVLLYELIAGARPAPGTTSSDPGWVEPSRAVESAPAGAAAGISPRRLRGDLDWIVWRAARRAPAERYASAAALADDVRRHRARLPVAAHPARNAYRLRRFVRRNWVGVAVASAALVALVAFAGATWLSAERVRAERDLARAERDRANASEARTRRVLAYLTGMFSDVRPEVARGNPPSAEELLERGARSLAEVEEDPAVRASLSATLGGVFADLGAYERAEALLVAAVEEPAFDVGERAHALNDLGALYVDTARYDLARPLLEEALSLRREALAAEGAEDDRGVAQSLNSLGRLAWEVGDLDGADRYYREALAVHERVSGADSYDVAVDLVNVSNVVNRRGDFAAGGEMLRRALAIFEAAGLGNDLHLADCLNNLGIVARLEGRYAEAVGHLERATEIRRAALGEGHPDVALSLTNLGSAWWSAGDLERARRYFEEGLAIRERVLAPDHPHVAFSVNALAVVAKNLGEFDEARRLYGRALAINRGKLGDRHPEVGRVLGNLGGLEVAVGRLGVGRERYLEALSIYVEAYGEEHADAGRILHALGELEIAAGDPLAARGWLIRAVAARTSALGEGHADTVASRGLLDGLGPVHSGR